MRSHRLPWTVAGVTLAASVVMTGLLAARAGGETPTPEKPLPDTIKKTQQAPVELSAGPVRLKFQDGELRYLKVGEKEIIRRIYFAVRDGNWNTAMPQFTSMQMDSKDNQFSIRLEAIARRGVTQYRWSGQIIGTPQGTITFHVQGEPENDFPSNRIGLCVLYGSNSLVGQTFETIDEKGQVTRGKFPELVSPDLVGKHFRTLKYTTGDGIGVSCGVDSTIFDMEDQRNWGDTSFKAYTPLHYAYPNAKKNQSEQQTVTLTVSAPATLAHHAMQGPAVIRLGKATHGTIPEIVKPDTMSGSPSFVDINTHRDQYKGRKEMTWSYTPTTHLPDEDTMMENIPAIVPQARTIHSFAPDAVLRVGPITLRGQAWPGLKAPEEVPFGGAWTMTFLKYLTSAGVHQASFAYRSPPTDAVFESIAPYAGKSELEVSKSPQDVRVDALAVSDKANTVVWLVNGSAEKTQVRLEGLGDIRQAKAQRLYGTTHAAEQNLDISGGAATLELGGYEVLRVTANQ